MRALASMLIVASVGMVQVAGRGQSPIERPPGPHQDAPAGRPQDYRFPSGAGMLFFYVKPDHTAEFEEIVARIGEALDKSDDPVRKEQAANFHVLQSTEVQRDAAIYVFLFDPAVPDADYDPVKILGESLPTEVHALYERLREATVKIERMGLKPIR
jgi:hypothetical protein